MKPTDFAKAFGLGVLALALNLGLLFVLGFIYATFVEPGRDEAYYMTVYPKIGSYSAPIAGIVLLFLAAWASGRRRPERNAVLFGLAIFVSYFVVDTAMGLAMGPLSALLVPPFLVGMTGGLAASLAGGVLARRAAA